MTIVSNGSLHTITVKNKQEFAFADVLKIIHIIIAIMLLFINFLIISSGNEVCKKKINNSSHVCCWGFLFALSLVIEKMFML